MMNKWVLTVAAVIIVVVVLGGFFVLNTNKYQAPSSQSASPTSPVETQTTTAPETVSQNEITVEGSEFKFAPSQISVKKGEKVKLTFKNAGSFPHNLTIEDLDVATKRIQPGQEDTIEFTPDKTGEFKFFCSVGNHEEQGMVGTLTVE